MVAVKVGAVDRFVEAPPANALIILVYGPDTGLADERARAIVGKLTDAAADPFATIVLDGGAMSSEPGRLADEMQTLSPFGGHRVVHVRHGDKALVKPIEAILDMAPEKATAVIEAGDLKRDSPLRKLVEGRDRAFALPCYADTDGGIGKLIDRELTARHITIDAAAREALSGLIGGDRLASRQELDKLALYVGDGGHVDLAAIEAIAADASALELDTLVDAVGLGDLRTADGTLGRLVAAGTAFPAIFGSLQRHFGHLRAGRSALDAGRTAEAAVKSIRPPVFFRREGAIRRQVMRWPLDAIEQATDALLKADLETRRRADLADAIAARAILSLTARASRMR